MANVYAIANGNWSAGATWNTGVVPTSADDFQFDLKNQCTVGRNSPILLLSVGLIGRNNKDYVPRSVTFADFLVVVSGFFVNIVRAVEMLASELLDLAVYHANRTTKVSRVWEQFTSDLEKMEDPNG